MVDIAGLASVLNPSIEANPSIEELAFAEALCERSLQIGTANDPPNLGETDTQRLRGDNSEESEMIHGDEMVDVNHEPDETFPTI